MQTSARAADSQQPLLVLGAIHCKHVTDLAWSADGKYLAASSHDGYCTMASFAPGDLGVPLKDASRVSAGALRVDIAAKRADQVRASVLRCSCRHRVADDEVICACLAYRDPGADRCCCAAQKAAKGAKRASTKAPSAPARAAAKPISPTVPQTAPAAATAAVPATATAGGSRTGVATAARHGSATASDSTALTPLQTRPAQARAPATVLQPLSLPAAVHTSAVDAAPCASSGADVLTANASLQARSSGDVAAAEPTGDAMDVDTSEAQAGTLCAQVAACTGDATGTAMDSEDVHAELDMAPVHEGSAAGLSDGDGRAQAQAADNAAVVNRDGGLAERAVPHQGEPAPQANTEGEGAGSVALLAMRAGAAASGAAGHR